MRTNPQRQVCRAMTAAVSGALFAFVASTPTAAQNPGGPPNPEMMQRMCADHDARFAGQMAFVSTKVGIRPEQKAAWDQFVSSSKAASSGLNPCKEGPPPFNDPVALRAKLDEMMEKGSEIRRAMKAAADKLAAALDTEQQRRFAEALLPPPMMGMPGMHLPG